MERLNPTPFPEIEEFRKVIPPQGIAFHGTSFENAQKILRSGFSVGFWGVTGLLHYYFISPEGSFDNTEQTLREYKDTLTSAWIRGRKHSTDPLEEPKLVLFIPQNPIQDAKPYCEVKKMILKGFPIDCVTDKSKGIKILGAVDFAREGITNGSVSVNLTLKNINNFLKNLTEPKQIVQP